MIAALAAAVTGLRGRWVTIARNHKAALVVLAINAADRGALRRGVEEIRGYLATHAPPGLDPYVTGPAGIAADLDQIAGEAGDTLLIATLGLVLVLLLLVCRAPVLALLPLIPAITYRLGDRAWWPARRVGPAPVEPPAAPAPPA